MNSSFSPLPSLNFLRSDGFFPILAFELYFMSVLLLFFSNSCVCTLLWLKFKRTAKKSSVIDAETFDVRIFVLIYHICKMSLIAMCMRQCEWICTKKTCGAMVYQRLTHFFFVHFRHPRVGTVRLNYEHKRKDISVKNKCYILLSSWALYWILYSHHLVPLPCLSGHFNSIFQNYLRTLKSARLLDTVA